MRCVTWTAVVVVGLALAGCGRSNGRAIRAEPPPPPRLTVAQVAEAIPAKVSERRAWAQAVINALDAIGQTPAREPVCAVLAVIEQESGFVANPVVANLAEIVETKLDELARKGGPFGRPALDRILHSKADGHSQSFATRLKSVRTERDLDLVFRDIVAYYRSRYPRTVATAEIAGALFSGTEIDDFNPITTAGSMQVSVRFAAELGRRRGLSREQVRDLLYTRAGGVELGTARLFAHDAGYDRYLYRFADYNAGVYASRNAALQQQVAALVGTELVLDGDLLAYDSAGNVLDRQTRSLAALLAFRSSFAPHLSEREVRRDARKEKLLDLEATETWRAIKRVFHNRQGVAPAYACVPELTLHSPKLSRKRTTAWFAQNVDRRFQTCLTKLRSNDNRSKKAAGG
ncbi:MAG TPA: DUF1615 family protein [Terriglobales bacterium]|nr:DUF1615 family protein [Terriglobales bacterium]